MFTKCILVAFSLTILHAEIVPLEDIWRNNDLTEESLHKDNITPLLNKMKAETDAKLSALEKHVEQIEENTNTKNRAIENMPDKLEKYLDRKFDVLMQLLLEENMTRRLIELESKIANLETILNLNLNDPQVNPDLDEQNNIKNNNFANTKCDKIEQNMNRKLDTIQKEMQYFGNLSTRFESKVFEKLHGLEANINQKWATVEKVVKNADHFTNLDDKSKAVKMLKRKYFKYVKKNAFEDNKKEKLKLCKELVASGFNFKSMFRLDNDTFDHVSLTKDSHGVGVADFEMHFAVKADAEATVLLSPRQNPNEDDPVYEIDMEGSGEDSFTHLRIKLKDLPYQHAATPNILSRTEYKTFTVRIHEGKQLEFVQNTYEGQKPIITYTNSDLHLVKYIGFSSWFENHNSWFLYDCPGW